MKSALAVTILALSGALAPAAQTSHAASPAESAPSLDAILLETQQAAQATNVDIARLKIEKWKADSSEKAQMQQVADSLHKNIAYAVPDLISDVRASHGSVSSTFKLYHNINVVFEYLSSLTDAAGGMGKSDEFESLTRDTSALDKARQDLSNYIEQAAAALESKARAATASTNAAPAATPQATPKKIVVDDASPHQKPATTRKKKTSASPLTPSPTPN
jgi:hypothetical protein